MKFHPVTVLLDLIYPPKCVLCGTLLTHHQHDFCDSCRKTLPVCDEKLQRTEVFDGVTAALWYQGAVRGSILRYKFFGRSHYSRCYGRLLAAACVRLPLENVDAVTWIPVSRRRRWRRGSGCCWWTMSGPPGPRPRRRAGRCCWQGPTPFGWPHWPEAENLRKMNR